MQSRRRCWSSRRKRREHKRVKLVVVGYIHTYIWEDKAKHFFLFIWSVQGKALSLATIFTRGRSINSHIASLALTRVSLLLAFLQFELEKVINVIIHNLFSLSSCCLPLNKKNCKLDARQVRIQPEYFCLSSYIDWAVEIHWFQGSKCCSGFWSVSCWLIS